jgi:hypothetical protein
LNPLDTFHIRHGTPPIALVTYREMPDSEVAVESERKNPFTITGFSVGKLLYVESISLEGRINSQVKGRFRRAQSYALDSVHVALKLVFQFALHRLTLSASTCGGEIYDREEKPPSMFGIDSAMISAAGACSPFIGRGMPLSIPSACPAGSTKTGLAGAQPQT